MINHGPPLHPSMIVLGQVEGGKGSEASTKKGLRGRLTDGTSDSMTSLFFLTWPLLKLCLKKEKPSKMWRKCHKSVLFFSNSNEPAWFWLSRTTTVFYFIFRTWIPVTGGSPFGWRRRDFREEEHVSRSVSSPAGHPSVGHELGHVLWFCSGLPCNVKLLRGRRGGV